MAGLGSCPQECGASPGVAGSRLLNAVRLTAVEHDRWADLAANAATPNAFLDPAFVVPAVRHLPGGEKVRILVATDPVGRWSALALVHPGSRWRRLPLPALSTWAHGQQGLATPLLDGRDVDTAATALVRAFRQQSPRAILIGLDEQAADGRTPAALEAALEAEGYRRTVWRSAQRALLRAEPGVPLPLESSRLRAKRRRLERVAGSVDVWDCSGPDHAELAAHTLLDLETSGWKGAAGTAMRQRPGEAAMLLEVTRAAARRGTLRALVLAAGGTPVAAQLDLVSGHTWFHWKTAYNDAFSTSSPGRLLMTHVLERFAEEGLQVWDSCAAPDHPLLDSLLPERRTIVEVAATRGRAATSVVRVGRALRRRRDRER